MAGFQSADYYTRFKTQKGYFKSDIKGVGEEAFSGPSSGGAEYMLVFRKGSHCISLTSCFNLGGPASKPLMLTKEQLSSSLGRWWPGGFRPRIQRESSQYLQEYLDEFCYRFNRRFWEPQLPMRLLDACLTQVPLKADRGKKLAKTRKKG